MKINCLFLCFILFACASPKAPDGGPKDHTSPVLIRAVPKNGSTQFNGKSIVLEFSENISENNLKKALISPKTALTINPLGKRLKISADSGWQPNTTYVINLSKKIKDDREGNLMKDSILTFSTGPILDTFLLKLEIREKSGKTSNQNYTALLYKSRIYSASTDSLKPLIIRGLRKQMYNLEVFNDKNENYQYEEEDGLLFTDSVEIDSNKSLTVKPLPQKYKPVKIFKQRKQDTCVVESNTPIVPDGLFKDKIISQNPEGTLFWLYPFTETFEHSFTDSIRNCFQDTLNYLAIDSNRSLPEIQIKRKVEIENENKNLKVTIKWNWAINKFPSTTEITQDSVWKPIPLTKTKFSIQFLVQDPKPGKLKVKMDTLTFYNKTGINKDSIEILKQDLDPKGSISGKIETSNPRGLIIELINSTKEIVGTTRETSFIFKVKPGKYTMLVYRDLDGDGYYTGGNKKVRRKAEPLYQFPDAIELKPGWDLENIILKPDL